MIMARGSGAERIRGTGIPDLGIGDWGFGSGNTLAPLCVIYVVQNGVTK